MATISVCMIVKNEEAVLARCLDSLQGLWDELIIVDTGSGDRTKEIAQKYTGQVYDFAWTGNFSDARNFSFSKAGCDYIYAADADEVLDEENREKFRQLKEALLPEVEIVQMFYGNQLSQHSIYNFDREYRPKLYKRLREFHWQEPIHEEVRLEPVVYDSDIEITHLPQGEHTGRDLETVEKILEQGGKLSPRLRDFYLRELYFAGDKHNLEKARPYLEGLVEEAEPDSDAFQRAEALLCREARLTGDEVRLLKYALKGVASAGSSELCLELGDYFAAKEDDQEAMLWYYNAAWETESYLDILASGEKPLKRLAECCRRMGDEAKAEEYLKQLEE